MLGVEEHPAMRHLLALAAILALVQCSTDEDDRVQPEAVPDAYVIIGIAEAPDSVDPSYAMLWRRAYADGFANLSMRSVIDQDPNIFEPSTNDGGSVRVRGIPGEFTVARLQPGIYALDSVFAVIAENRVNYFANGVIEGPARPSFEVRPGEAIYLGIWEVRIDGNTPSATLWRLDEADARAVVRAAREDTGGDVRLRRTDMRTVPCTPHRISGLTQRQIC